MGDGQPPSGGGRNRRGGGGGTNGTKHAANSTAPPHRSNLRGDGYGGGGNGYAHKHHGHHGGGYTDDFSLSGDSYDDEHGSHGGSSVDGPMLRNRRQQPADPLEHVQSHNYEPDESEIWRAYTAQQHFRNRGQWWTTGKKRALKRWSLTLLIGVIQGIVAFTFTERAAQELKDRIEARVEVRLGRNALDRINGLFVGTIHAYCFRLLQQLSDGDNTHPDGFGLGVAFRQKGENDRAVLENREAAGVDFGGDGGVHVSRVRRRPFRRWWSG